MRDLHVTYREIETSVGISYTSVQKILHEHLSEKEFVRVGSCIIYWCKEILKKYSRKNLNYEMDHCHEIMFSVWRLRSVYYLTLFPLCFPAHKFFNHFKILCFWQRKLKKYLRLIESSSFTNLTFYQKMSLSLIGIRES